MGLIIEFFTQWYIAIPLALLLFYLAYLNYSTRREPEDNYEYLLDLTGKLSCRGITQDGSFLLEGKTYLAVNQTIMAYTEKADFEIRIIAIEKNT